MDDRLDISNGHSEDCNGNNIPDECEGWPVWLSMGSDALAFEQPPRHLAAGDLDHDGDLDLVVGQRSGVASSLSVILNQGSRTFEKAGNYVVGSDLCTLSLLDLNGDGLLDVAAA